MTRIYSFVKANETVSAGDEAILEFTPAVGKPITILSITITNESLAGDTNEEMVEVIIKRGVTTGSVGSALAASDFEKYDAGDGDIAVTGERGNTTPATGGDTMHSEAFNNRVGWFYKPIPEERIHFDNAQGIGEISFGNVTTEQVFHIVIVFAEGFGA